MVRRLLILLAVGLIFCFFAESAMSQFMGGMKYSKGRLFLSNGTLLEGKDLMLGTDSVTINLGGMVKTYDLSEVQQIMIKKGLAPKWGAGCGGGCLAFYVIGLLATGVASEFETSQIIVEVTTMTCLSYGVGYLIGYLLDDWTPIYFGRPRAFNPGPLQPKLASGHSKGDVTLLRYNMEF